MTPTGPATPRVRLRCTVCPPLVHAALIVPAALIVSAALIVPAALVIPTGRVTPAHVAEVVS